MKHKTFIANRIIAVMLLTSVFTFAFVWSGSSASSQPDGSAVEQTFTSEAEEPTSVYQPKRNVELEASSIVLRAQKRGFPLINLQDGKRLETKFVGTDSAIQSFASAQALTMTNADLNLDGAPDLVVGYASNGGGHLALYAGNPDSLSTRTPEAFEAVKEGRFPAPFRPEARLLGLPVTPDFIGTGDFNRDGWKDIIAAQRGMNSIILLAGNAKGNYKKPQTIELPGSVTALLAENIDPADGQADVAVALSDSNGAWLFVFDDEHDAFAEQPRMYPLPAEATSLALGQLDDSAPMDILAAAGGKAVVIHGSHSEKDESPEIQLKADAGQIQILSAGEDVAAVQIGHFIWDRANQPEIALLGASGTIRILQRGNIDQRQYSEEEWEAHWTKQEAQDQIELQLRSADPTNRSIRTLKQARQTVQNWTEADSFQLSSGYNFSAVSPSSVFTSARMTTQGVENLIVADSTSNKIKVLLQNNETLKSENDSYQLSATGNLAAIEFDSAASPAAVLPMRLNVMSRPGLVMLDKNSAEVSYAVAAPVATYTVNTTVDTSDGVCDANCSLRDAIRAANNTVNTPDVVMVPAGTYTLTIGPSDDSGGVDPAAQAQGDLDVRDDLTITGSGQAGTIIQAGTLPSNGIDRVLHMRQRSVGIPDISISGVTIRNGRCYTSGSAVATSARCNTGGAGIFHSVDDLGAFTVSDSTITSNWNVADLNQSIYLNGAGIYVGRGDANLTNVTISNNENGAANSVHGGDGGGLLFGFSSATNTNTVTMTNCTVTGNVARLITNDTLGGMGGGFNGAYDVTNISGGTYSNNTADLDGGAIYNLTNTGINNLTVSGNNAKRDGGGIWSDPFPTSGLGTNTITNVTLRGNTADSDNAVNLSGDPRGAGGGIYHDRGTLNLTGVTIGGTTAGQPNTSYDGGGLGHRYRAPASTNNASTITVNGGSIVGNVANNDGGGVFHDATRTAGANSTLNIAPTTAVTLTNNSAKNNGGGVSNSGGASATLANMTLRSNRANSDASGGGDGGALYQNTAGSTTTFTGTLTIGGSGFANQAVNGGGIRNNAGMVTFPASASITHNTASATGGGISNAGTLSALASPVITNNVAAGNGGGILNTGTLGAITTPTLNLNSAATGGGIFSSNGALLITNGTVNQNTATTGKGGGIEHSGSAASSVTSVMITSNTGSGIHITGTGSLDVISNTITNNSGDGITKIGTGVGSHFNSNTIHSNGELGIDLSDNAVTPNDANDTDAGPNNLQNFPVINWVRRGNGIANVTLNSPNGKYRIQYYKNAACDSSGHGEGEVLMTSQVVDITSVATQTFSSPGLAFDAGVREQITATATHDANGNNNFDDDGSTSEFSACRQVNRLPTFSTAQTISRQQGTVTGNNGIIATVNDLDQAANTLSVTVNGSASATVNGVAVSNVQIAANGNVTADVVASCTATNATFTLRVTDTPGEFNEQTLSVNVTPNTPPMLGTYPNTTVNAASSGTIVTPNAAPTDNGTVATLTASAPGFTGTFVGNAANGTVTVNNAGPFGVYTVTVTATDNCGAATIGTFTLTVNAIPTIAAQAGLTRQQGTAVSNSQIATVNDNDQTENTLVVTVRAVGGVAPGTGTAIVNGVVVSNIAVSAAGVVTADVEATCAATVGNANFTVRVADSTGAFTETTLTVAVNANTPPAVGTYSNTSLVSGGGTIVTPTSAPTDNGSVASATVAAPGFTGTLSVNQTTGVVTIANANPGGTYTVTVSITDNCGAATTRTFTLSVTYTMSGVISYGNTSAGDPVKFVPGVTLTAAGAPPASTVTANNGTYTLSGLGTGAYTVTPSKTGDVNGIESLDATRIQQHLVGLIVLTPNQLIAADVDNNGTVNSLDAARIQQYLVQIQAPNIIGQWKFVPVNRQYASISSNLTGQNYEAILVGDVSGNWTPAAPPLQSETDLAAFDAKIGDRLTADGVSDESVASSSAVTAEQSAALGTQASVALPASATASTGNNITVPISIGAVSTGAPVESFDFAVYYDPAVLQISSPVGGNAGTSSAQCSVLANAAIAGRVIVSGACANPAIATASGSVLYNLNFTVVGTGNQMSGLSFTNPATSTSTFQFNNGTPSVATTNGQFMVIAPTAASVSVSGRVTNNQGRSIDQVLITMTDAQGGERTARTTSFGYYKFENVAAGETITLTAKAKRHKFVQSSIVRTTNDSVVNADFISQ